MEILGLVTVPNWLLILLVLLLTYYVYITWQNDVFRNMGVPVPDGGAFLGHLMKYQKEGMYGADTEWIKKYGKVYGTFDVGVPNLIVADTDMLKQILVKDFNIFPDRRTFEGFNGELESGLTDLKGEHWRHVRNILTPTFSAGKLKRMVPLLTDASERLLKNTKLNIKESNIQDVKRIFGGYTMDVIASTAFGIEVDSQSNPDDPFVKHAIAIFKVSLANFAVIVALFFPFTMPILRRLGVQFFPRSSGRFFKQTILKVLNDRKLKRREFKDFLQLMVEAKKSNEESENTSSTTKSTWDSSVKGLTTDEIVAQAILFFIAGYETTGTTLSLLAGCLAMNPDIQEKLYQEIVEKLGPEKPSYDNVQELVYMEMCINETLRMFPPAPRFDRVCIKDTEVKGFKIPKGMIVSVPSYAIHHSPDVWENPEEFKPERFSPEEKAKMNPLHFLPFGYGPRNCIGMRLAYLEAKVALADFVRNFTLSTCEKTKFPPEFQKFGLLLPDNLWLKIEERS